MRTLTRTLYKAARTSASVRAVQTGHIVRRTKNVAVGRTIGKMGGWWRLWR